MTDIEEIVGMKPSQIEVGISEELGAITICIEHMRGEVVIAPIYALQLALRIAEAVRQLTDR